MTLLWREVGAQVLKASQSHQIWLADGSQSLSEVNSISTWNGCLPCRNVNYSWAVTFSKLQWDASSKTCCSSMSHLYKPALLTVIKNEAQPSFELCHFQGQVTGTCWSYLSTLYTTLWYDLPIIWKKEKLHSSPTIKWSEKTLLSQLKTEENCC